MLKLNDNEKNDIGRLIVCVRTANGAIPVKGALVNVRSFEIGESSVIASRTTDISGNTDTIEIATPSVDLSKSPGSEKGYTSVVINVSRDGFVSTEFIGAAIFPGITTVQQVNLVPSGEFSERYDMRVYNESEAADL